MKKNERNAGRKTKFKKGIKTFVIADKLPLPAKAQIKEFIDEISEPYLNDEIPKSKQNVK